MKNTPLKLTTVFLFCLGLAGVQAQTSINTTGGNATSTSGTVSYSVGQVVYQTTTGTTGTVSEGVQQPFEIYVITGIDEAKGILLSVSAYPNPTTDYLSLEVKDFELSDLSYMMLDMNGKLLQKENISENLTNINMKDFVSANYVVKVLQGNKEIKSFKIIKN